MTRTRRFALALTAAATLVAGLEAAAWTPESHRLLAEQAARLAPPDLYRQIVRNRDAYRQGISDGFAERDPAAHVKNDDGSGRLDQAIAITVENAIRTIEAPRPFNEIAYRLGIVAHFVADAHNPLNSAESDPEEGRYYADFLRYIESAAPRVRLVFYGFRPGFEGRRDLPALVDAALVQGRELYPMVGREYRRIGFRPGVEAFDDRSTAFAVASLAHSYAISDIAEVLRYIWLEAGGIDTRRRIPVRGREVIALSNDDPLPRISSGR